ncbi:hypothetical protein IAU60_001298 [Kwoniella sp. DSM 27419]
MVDRPNTWSENASEHDTRPSTVGPRTDVAAHFPRPITPPPPPTPLPAQGSYTAPSSVTSTDQVLPAGITIIPPSPLSTAPAPSPSDTTSRSYFASSQLPLPSSTHRREHTFPKSPPRPSVVLRSYSYQPFPTNTAAIPSLASGSGSGLGSGSGSGIPQGKRLSLKRLSIDESSSHGNFYSTATGTGFGYDAQTPTAAESSHHTGIHRRRTSVTSSQQPHPLPQTYTPPRSRRQSGGADKLRSPVTAPASSSALGWLTGSRLTLPPTQEKHSKSDDERESDPEGDQSTEQSVYASAAEASSNDEAWFSSASASGKKNRRKWRMSAQQTTYAYGNYGESSSSGAMTPSISMSPPDSKVSLMPNHLPVNTSPPRSSVLPSQAPLASPSNLHPLPQDPYNILPLSSPGTPYGTPGPSRCPTPLHSAHPSMADLASEYVDAPPPPSGSGSSPRTSISTSSSRYGWATGRSDSRSSEDDDVMSPITTSHPGKTWWQESRPNGRISGAPKMSVAAAAPRLIRMSSATAQKLIPSGTRSWGWLVGKIPVISGLRGNGASLAGSAAAPARTEPLPRKNSISAKARNRERDRLMTGGPNRRKRDQKVLGSKWLARVMVFVPTQPWTISFFLLFVAFLAVSLTFTIKHILNPDKEALPWRQYCTADYPTLYSLQDPSLPPPHINYEVNSNPSFPSSSDVEVGINSFAPSSSKPLSLMPLTPAHPAWPYHPNTAPPFTPETDIMALDEALEPVGVFIGVFTTDAGAERRHMIRQTYASHWRSRRPGTEGVRIRFVMGRPRKRFEAAIQLEMEAFNDILLLDIEENMNSGKTHAFFSWASENATVPAWEYPARLTDEDGSPLGRAQPIWRGEKKPSYVVKADDDAMIMLGELETRLRVAPRNKAFWGYLVKNSFMAGECYALSYDLVQYIGASPALRTLTHGKEDKLVAKWMNMHPEREQIVWVTERCWIYDHPRAGTVYSHGFLFPSTVAEVRQENATGLAASVLAIRGGADAADAYSTVSKFGTTYRPLTDGMSAGERVEALIEGSSLSLLRNDLHGSASAGNQQQAYSHVESPREKISRVFKARPSRSERFLGDPEERGGTVVVHYIKKPEWFVEAAIALLGGPDDQAVWHRGAGMGLGAMEMRKGRVVGAGAGESHVGHVGHGEAVKGVAKGDGLR